MRRKRPKDSAWPPLGVRDLKPDIKVGDRPSIGKFGTLRQALESAEWSGLCPAGRHGLDYQGQECDICRHEAGGPCTKICRRCYQDKRGRSCLL